MRYRIPSLWMIAAVAAGAPLPAPAAPQAPQAHYRIIARYAVGGNETGYDYIKRGCGGAAPATSRTPPQVEALDADDGRKIGAIQGIERRARHRLGAGARQGLIPATAWIAP